MNRVLYKLLKYEVVSINLINNLIDLFCSCKDIWNPLLTNHLGVRLVCLDCTILYIHDDLILQDFYSSGEYFITQTPIKEVILKTVD